MPPVNNPQNPMDPEQNTELEALAQLGMQGNEISEGIEANTEASAVKLNEIEQNQEAQLMQSMKSTKDMIAAVAPSLQAQERMANIFSSLMTNLEGPPGKTPEKGKDYFTNEEIADFLNKATPKKGKDYFTAEDIESFKKQVTPVKGKDYKDGEDGYTPVKGKDYRDGVDGTDGRNPLSVSKNAPQDPQIGDLWYQP